MIKASVCVVKQGKIKKILMLKRHPYDRTFSGWCLPGGKCDKGKTQIETAIRELKEETGLSGRVVEDLGTYQISKYIIYAFMVEVLSFESLFLYPTEEMEGSGWFDPEEAMCLEIGPVTKQILEKL